MTLTQALLTFVITFSIVFILTIVFYDGSKRKETQTTELKNNQFVLTFDTTTNQLFMNSYKGELIDVDVVDTTDVIYHLLKAQIK